MSDKSKYTIFEIIIPGYVYIKPNVNVLCEAVHEIWKSNFLSKRVRRFDPSSTGLDHVLVSRV